MSEILSLCAICVVLMTKSASYRNIRYTHWVMGENDVREVVRVAVALRPRKGKNTLFGSRDEGNP